MTQPSTNESLVLSHEHDIARIQGSEAAKLPEQVKVEIAAAPPRSND